jgi:signal transduction histidine kinase
MRRVREQLFHVAKLRVALVVLLEQHAEILETKITERTAKLHETITQLESFSYTVAHDLRAPIRSLKGFSEILLNDYGSAMPEAAQGLVGRLLRALPDVMVVDGYGASETGGNARSVAVAGAAPRRTFAVGEETSVLDDELRPVPPDDGREGWLARRGVSQTTRRHSRNGPR